MYTDDSLNMILHIIEHAKSRDTDQQIHTYNFGTWMMTLVDTTADKIAVKSGYRRCAGTPAGGEVGGRHSAEIAFY